MDAEQTWRHVSELMCADALRYVYFESDDEALYRFSISPRVQVGHGAKVFGLIPYPGWGQDPQRGRSQERARSEAPTTAG